MAAGSRVTSVGAGVLAVLVVLHLGVDIVLGAFTTLLPLVEDRFDLTAGQTAGLVTTLAAGSSLAQPLMGTIADRFGTRSLATGGAVLASLVLALPGVLPHPVLLYASAAVGGLGLAAFHPAASALARQVARDRSELAVGLFAAGGTLGLAVGPLVVLGVVAGAGLRATPWLMVPGLALSMLLWLKIPAAPHPATPRSGRAELLSGRMLLLTAAGTLAATAGITFTAGIPRWMVENGGVPADAVAIAWTLTAFSVAGAVAGITASWLWRDRRPSRLIAGSLAAATVPLLGTLLTRPGSPAFYLGVGAAGFLLSAGIPATVAMTGELAPHDVAAATGVVLGLTNGLAGVLYLGVGQAQAAVGLEPALAGAFLSTLPAAALTIAALSCGPRGLIDRLSPFRLCSCLVP